MALKGALRRKLEESWEKRKLKKQAEKERYEQAYKKAIESKQIARQQKKARMMAGVKRKWKKEDYWKKKYEREKKRKRTAPRKALGYLDVGKSIPQPQPAREESFASLMTEGRGLSLTDFPQQGRSLMDWEKEKKKKKGFSIADW